MLGRRNSLLRSLLLLLLAIFLLFVRDVDAVQAADSNEDDDSVESDGAMDDTADEEIKFYRELKSSEQDVRIKEQALRVAEANLRAFKLDDSDVREAKTNFSNAMVEEEDDHADLDDKNDTLIEAEKELKVAQNISKRALHREEVLLNASRKANLHYKVVLGNVTQLRNASALAKEHVQMILFAEAKKRAALVLKDAVAKVAALKRVAAGHHIFENLRDQLAEIKKHKQAKDMDESALAELIAKAKETAKNVRNLRDEMQEAQETTGDAKKKLEDLIKQGRAPEGSIPGPEADKYMEKVRTIKDWIAALDLKHAGAQKNITTMRLVKYRAKKLKAALAMVAEIEAAEIAAKGNFTMAEQKFYNSTLKLKKANHVYHLMHTTHKTEVVLEKDRLNERLEEAKFALSAAKQKLERMQDARKAMENAKQKTEESSKQLEKTSELARDVKKDDPFVPPRLRNSGDIDLAPPAKNPMDVATRELVWGDGKGAEQAFSTLVNDMEAKAKKDAQKELLKSLPIERQQAAMKNVLKDHPLTKAKTESHRFKESNGWVEPKLNDNSNLHQHRFAAIKAHLKRSRARAHAKASHGTMIWKAGGRLGTGNRMNSKVEDHSEWTVVSNSDIFAESKKAAVQTNVEALKSQPSHCYDGVKDYGETGVDCGGACARKCGLQHVQMLPDKDNKYHHVTIVPNDSARATGETPEIVKKLTDCDKSGTRCSHATDLNDPNLRVVSEKHAK